MPQTHNGRRHPLLYTMERITKLGYGTLLSIWIGLAIAFAVAYFLLTFLGEGQHAPPALLEMSPLRRFLNSLYYSIITATSTGYGDITPAGFSKVLASLQSMSALFIFAVFVTKLVSHRQELTLSEVHRLSFEDIFHNTREGLFVCRKDFDNIITEAQEKAELSPESWENLTTAYEQAQTLFEEIPDFYENEMHKYTIDAKREKLLLEATHRTLHRINQMLDTLSAQGIDWLDEERSAQQLRELTEIVRRITPLWQERSPYHETHEAFEDILELTKRVHGRIGKVSDAVTEE